jgi:GT2 family glycosyltransferase
MGAPQATTIDDQYQLWLSAHALTPARIRRISDETARLAYRPKVSIITPTYNSDPVALREAIESVRSQLYEDWELCVADDASTSPEVGALLREYSGDDRIKVTYLEQNSGISAASNAALALATGEFVGLLDHDDELKPDALYQVVRLLNERPDLDFIYSDEDKRDADGRLVQPFFKPDWSPDLLLCENYVPHFAVYRRRILEEVGGLRSECDFSQDYDLVLRVTERTDRIAHIPLPLYTWRMIPGSAALESGAKPRAVDAARLALSDAIQRRGLDADVLEGPHPNTYRVRYRIKGQPLVSVIIPTRDRVELLRPCIASIEQKTTYSNYEIIIVDNDSEDEATLDYLKKSPHRRLPFPGPFHYAAMMNSAVREAAGKHVILLNNDTEVITPDWIEAMLEHSQRDEVAAVGARLLFPNGRPQHEGVILGLGGGSALNADHKGYFGLGDLVLNCSAVTGACMMARREAWEHMEGFDESLGVAFNDVDYCLRARREGLLVVYTPFAVLYHHESASRGTLHPEEDEQFFRKRWGKPGEYRDPYYNPNLSLIRPFNLDI